MPLSLQVIEFKGGMDPETSGKLIEGIETVSAYQNKNGDTGETDNPAVVRRCFRLRYIGTIPTNGHI